MRRPSARPIAALLGASLAATVAVTAPSASAVTVHTRHSVLTSATTWAGQHGYKAGIAVYDTRTGYVMGKNSYATFASESVVKAMIATRILLQGRMHGTTAKRAYTMITRSDDGIASSLYGSVGGDGLITWVKKHYGIPFLGSPPRRSGWWGNTHITAAGMVTLYAKIKKDPKVGPWLINAMHHATTHGSDGFYQFFGLKHASSTAAIKQGWGFDYDDWSRSADMNSTGFVGAGDRYAVAILVRGPARTYGTTMGNALSRMAQLLLPGGTLPEPTPTVTSLSATSGSTAGGTTVDLRGSDLTGVTAVWFGASRATAVKPVSSHTVRVTAPRHAAGLVAVRVATSHGSSSGSVRFRYGAPPTVAGVSDTEGPTAGGTSVTVSGQNLAGATAVYFGATRAPVTSVTPTSVAAVVPQHVAGTVDVRVRTPYGLSPVARPAAAFTYVAGPAATGLSPASGRPGTTVTVTGTGLDASTPVSVDGVAVQPVSVSPTSLTVVVPEHAPGAAVVRVASSSLTFTYVDAPAQ